MSEVKTADVEKWASEQIGTTILSKRRKALGFWKKRSNLKMSEKEKDKNSFNTTQELAGNYEEKVMGL